MSEIGERILVVRIEILRELDEVEKQAVEELQRIAFRDVDEVEAEEDFYDPPSAQVVAYVGRQLVGWAGIHETEQDFEGSRLRLGGYGICTHPKWRGRGIGTKVSRVAKNILKQSGCDVAFLSVDPSNLASVKLHEKNGFVKLPRDFSWRNSKGAYKHDSGGMIALVNSEKQFERVLNGKDMLYVGNGYW